MIYLTIFFISYVCVLIGLNIRKKTLGKMIVLIGLLIPCILAGVRNISVGTDTSGYVFNIYNIAISEQNIIEYFKTVNDWYLIKDYLYLICTYFIAHLDMINAFQILLFVYQCLITFPLYFAIKNFNRNSASIAGTTLVINLFFYNMSLNMVRQMVAISFFLLSFSYFVNEKKNWKLSSIVCFLIAVGFHDTVVFALPIYYVYKLYSNNKINGKSKSMITFIGAISISFLILFYRNVVTFISNIGLYTKGYIYLQRFGQGININYLGTFINVLLIVLIAKNKKLFKSNYKFGFFISVINLVLSILGFFITYANRLSYYLLFLLLTMYIPFMFSNKKRDLPRMIIIILVFFIYWIWVYLVHNSGETFPYQIFL